MTDVGQLTNIPSINKRMAEVVGMVRLYTRDHPALNRLIKGEESSDRMIMWAVLDCIDDFNTSPPFLNLRYGVGNFPSLSLLREGTTTRLLESVALLNIRNHLQCSDGGIALSVSDKAPMLMSFIQLLRSSYEQKKMAMKGSINIEMAFGGSGHFSEYSTINNLYLTL